MKTYKAEAWVHPKNGGDDYQIELDIDAESAENASKLVTKWLKRRSDVTDDFVIREVA